MFTSLLSTVLSVAWAFASATITHSAVTPDLDAALGSAIETWGSASAITDGGAGTDIVAVWGETPMHSEAMVDICYEWDPECDQPGLIRGCVIYVDPQWPLYQGADIEWRQNMLIHEVGHCLGLEHPGVTPSIMERIGDGFSPYDAERIAALYPPAAAQVEEVFKLWAPGLTTAR